MPNSLAEYSHGDAAPSHTASYIWPVIFDILECEASPGTRVFDLGCGNGAFAAALDERGYDVTGVDPSEEGIARAHKAHPELNLRVGSAYDDLTDRFGRFPVVTSLEVIEHVYDPYRFATCVFDLLEEGGVAVLSTPYHSYLNPSCVLEQPVEAQCQHEEKNFQFESLSGHGVNR
jgi:2-polyprenyl-6-hydroxyphenyl methylase/3-demethylubiquinone-9 3-methyltransferase